MIAVKKRKELLLQQFDVRATSLKIIFGELCPFLIVMKLVVV